jgi:hypothetical protein
MRLTGMSRLAQGVRAEDYPESSVDLEDMLEHVKWNLWHGKVDRVLEIVDELVYALDLEGGLAPDFCHSRSVVALLVALALRVKGFGEPRPRGPLRLLARGVDGDLGAAAGRGTSPGSADGSHLPAASASAEELIAAIGLEPRHAYSRRHLEPLQDLSRSRIDSPQIVLVTFPGAVPELSVDPGDPGDEAV